MKAGKAANTDPKIRLMRRSKTDTGYKYGMGGLPKSKAHAPKPVTLAPIKLRDPKSE